MAVCFGIALLCAQKHHEFMGFSSAGFFLNWAKKGTSYLFKKNVEYEIISDQEC